MSKVGKFTRWGITLDPGEVPFKVDIVASHVFEMTRYPEHPSMVGNPLSFGPRTEIATASGWSISVCETPEEISDVLGFSRP
jgi:hypothetical protein